MGSRKAAEEIDLDKISARHVTETRASTTPLKIACGCLAAAVIALAIAVAILASKDNSHLRSACSGTSGASSSASASTAEAEVTFPPRVASAFDPFTQEELDAIAQHVRTTLSLADGEPAEEDGYVAADWLHTVDFLPTTKATVLGHVDNSAAFTGRHAKAIVYHLNHLGNPSASKVVEYKVGPIAGFPISQSTPVTAIQQGGTLGVSTDIPYLMRPVSNLEYTFMETLVVDAFHTLANLSAASWGEQYDDGNIYWTDSAPRGYTRATRQTWIWFVWYMEGMFQLPIGIQMLIDHKSLNASDWSIIEISYNGGGPYTSAQDLADAFDSNSIDVIDYRRPTVDDWENAPLWSSMRRRGEVRPLEERPIPAVAPLGGKRFSVSGRQVQWLGWDFHVGYMSVQGINFNDIRFRNQRIVYELSLQDAFAAYSGMMPLQSLAQYSDGGWGMGVSNFELIPGVDCPIFATMLDTEYFVGGSSGINKNSICIWEQPEDMAVMRHYDQDFVNGGGFTFVAGYPRTILVVRTSSTVYNYDYYFSYIFHLDGTIQVTTIASGYLQADFYPQSLAAQTAEAPFSNRVQNHTIGSLHDHFFHYKVDLDVLGAANSLMRSRVKVGTFNRPWNFGVPGSTHKLKYSEREMVATEAFGNSTYTINPTVPTMFMFGNTDAANNGNNAWGVMRTYAISVPGTAIQLMPDDAAFMPASQWTKYTVAVTRRHDAEMHSCRVLYDMQAPSEPLLEFESYTDGESLDQEDLVAWVNMGSLHLPTSEDVPVTTTPGTSTSFYIRPNNYFDESPVVDLTRRYFKVGNDMYSGGAPAVTTDAVNLPSSDRCFDDTEVTEFGTSA